MQFIASPKKIIGLDISDLSIKAVRLRKKEVKNILRLLLRRLLPRVLSQME